MEELKDEFEQIFRKYNNAKRYKTERKDRRLHI